MDEDAAVARILADEVIVDSVRRMVAARRRLFEIRPVLNASRPAVVPGSPEAAELQALHREESEAEREEARAPQDLSARLTELVHAEAYRQAERTTD